MVQFFRIQLADGSGAAVDLLPAGEVAGGDIFGDAVLVARRRRFRSCRRGIFLSRLFRFCAGVFLRRIIRRLPGQQPGREGLPVAFRIGLIQPAEDVHRLAGEAGQQRQEQQHDAVFMAFGILEQRQFALPHRGPHQAVGVDETVDHPRGAQDTVHPFHESDFMRVEG